MIRIRCQPANCVHGFVQVSRYRGGAREHRGGGFSSSYLLANPLFQPICASDSSRFLTLAQTYGLALFPVPFHEELPSCLSPTIVSSCLNRPGQPLQTACGSMLHQSDEVRTPLPLHRTHVHFLPSLLRCCCRDGGRNTDHFPRLESIEDAALTGR